MGCETNLPSMVSIYLELIEKLISLRADVDTGGDDHLTIGEEIDFYFKLVRTEMEKSQECEVK